MSSGGKSKVVAGAPAPTFRPLAGNARRYLPPSAQETPETRFWRKFRNPASEQHGDPVTSVHCSPAAPFDYAVSAGTKVSARPSALSV